MVPAQLGIGGSKPVLLCETRSTMQTNVRIVEPPDCLLFYIRHRQWVKRLNGLYVQIDISDGCDAPPNM